MKRIIKFRGKYNDTWVFGSLLIGTGKVALCQIENVDFDNHLLYDVDPETVGQFTGKVDKKDTPIYDGDINQDNGYVMWGEDSACWLWVFPNGDMHDFMDEQLWCEIIGNIHDNPNLIK